MKKLNGWVGVLLSFAAAACSAGDPGAETGTETATGSPESVAAVDQAVVSGWTSYAYPGSSVVCDNGGVIGMQCTGANCSGIRLYCSNWAPTTDHHWLDYISEESPNNWSSCPTNEIITGIACTGTKCDNVAVRCSKMPGFLTYGTYSMRTFSEEQGAVFTQGDQYPLVALGCSGGYCDNLTWVPTLVQSVIHLP